MVEIAESKVSWLTRFLWLWIKWIIQWVDVSLGVTTLDSVINHPQGPICWQGITGRRAGISFSKWPFEVEALHASQREDASTHKVMPLDEAGHEYGAVWHEQCPCK